MKKTNYAVIGFVICMWVLWILLALKIVKAENVILTPDGTYIQAIEYTLAPDGSYVSGTEFQITPDGDYVGTTENTGESNE